jgi:antitoxin component YwqK of YwqJK toxin-antitoxin module
MLVYYYLKTAINSGEMRENRFWQRDRISLPALIALILFSGAELSFAQQTGNSGSVTIISNKGILHGLIDSDGDEYDYIGDLLDNKPDGNGIATFKNGDRYAGYFKSGKRDGTGTYIWADGDRYEGEWKDDLKDGIGTFTQADGNLYEGEWQKGVAAGKGIMILSSGDRYEGDFKNNLQDGKGTFTWADGDRYEGEWSEGDMNGKGIQIYANGNRYEGNYKDDLKDGIGTFTWAGGSRYVGEWRAGEMSGKGIYFFQNGDLYEGEFLENQRNGIGTYTLPPGKSIEYCPGCVKYVGEWLDNRKHGFGKCFDKDGKVIHEGRFANGAPTQPYPSLNQNDVDIVVEKPVHYVYVQAKEDKKHEEFYSNGKLKVRGIKRNGLWVGEYTTYYDNGQLYAIGNFNDYQLKTGLWKYFHWNGQLYYEVMLENDLRYGEVKAFDRDGRIDSIFSYQNGKLHGEFKSLHFQGGSDERGYYSTREVGNYVNGKKEGEWRGFTSGKEPEYVRNYKNGVEDGDFEEFGDYSHTKGRINGEYKYIEATDHREEEYFLCKYTLKNDKFHGEFQAFYKNGKPSEQGYYTDGVKDGVFKNYYSNGKLAYSAAFNLGVRYGKVMEYFENGKLDYSETYKNGELVHGDGISYFANGRLSEIEKVISDSEVEYKSYHENGKLETVGYYKNNVENGEWKEFRDDGTPASVIVYKDGVLHGIYKSYHSNGTIEESGYYKDGSKDGEWKGFNESGKQLFARYYQNGKLISERKF